MGRSTLTIVLIALLFSGCVRVPSAAQSANAPVPSDGDVTNATPLAAVIKARNVQPLDPASPMPLLDQAMVQLAKTDEGERYRGVTYDLTRDNGLDAQWLIQSPNIWGRPSATLAFMPLDCKGHCEPDFRLAFCRRNSDCGAGAVCGRLAAFGDLADLAGKRLCLGQADSLVDRFYRPIVTAQQAVDVTLLEPAPDYRFLAALRNAMTVLAESHRHVTVRLLIGQFPPAGADAKAFLDDLIRDARKVHGANLTIYASAMRSCGGNVFCRSFSWNHAKIVAVDGRTAVVGGHNLWTQDYLIDQPVHDLSMQVSGGAARDAHRFADALWDYVCSHDDPLSAVSMYVYRSGSSDIAKGCLAKIGLPPAASATGGGTAILSIGRLGSGITEHFANQDDVARELFFGAARHEILVAQQDVAFQLPGELKPLYPELTMAAWADFILAGRGDVYLVLSSDGAVGRSKSTYSNGVPIASVADKMLDVAAAHSSLPRPALVELLCQHFHLAPFRFSRDGAWPEKAPIGNHGKFWMVDDRTFYVGSDNLYPVDLQEFGYIVDSAAAAATIRRDYWNPLWRWSKSFAISGSDAPNCSLRKKLTS